MGKKEKILCMKMIGIVIFSLALSLIQPSAASSSEPEKFLTIGAGPLAGSYGVMGGGLSAYLTNSLQGCVVTSRLTGGSVENTRLLAAHKVDLAFLAAMVGYQKAAGIGLFKGEPSKDLRWISVATLDGYHWVTLARSKIKTMKDLVGKKVSIGPPGSGTAMCAKQVLEAYGLLDKVKINQLGFSESANSLRDGHLDAVSIGSPVPVPAIVDLTSIRKVRLLSVDDEILNSLMKAQPFYVKYPIPVGSYQGVEEAATVVGVGSLILANKNVSKERVYEITKLIYMEKVQKHMKSVYSAWDLNPAIDAANRMGIPLHPGTEQYFKEKGILK